MEIKEAMNNIKEFLWS